MTWCGTLGGRNEQRQMCPQVLENKLGMRISSVRVMRIT